MIQFKLSLSECLYIRIVHDLLQCYLFACMVNGDVTVSEYFFCIKDFVSKPKREIKNN